MKLHYIAEDLENHAWYEALFVRTIGDAEAYVAGVAELEAALSRAQDPYTGTGSPSPARTSP
jgi:hypothetical protein